MKSKKRRHPVSEKVARVLRAERIARGFSMTEVAYRAGLSQQMISHVEKTTRNPSLDTLIRIVHGLSQERPQLKLSDVIRRAEKL